MKAKPTFHSLRVQEVRRETADCVSVSFDVPETLTDAYAFTQGQYLTLKTQINGEEVRRSYSICTSPLDDDLRVAIKEVPDGKFSTFANQHLQKDTLIDVMTPTGNFFTELSETNEKNYVCFAAGSGITPVMSIMKTVLQREPNSQFTLFYGNKGADSVIFKEKIDGLKSDYMNRLTVHHILSREHPGSDLFYGRIDEEKCQSFCNLLLDVKEVDEFFLCGPKAMIRAVSTTLEKEGVDKKRIHFELFTSPLGKLDGKRKVRKTVAKNIISKIKITSDSNLLQFDLESEGVTILDAALAAGADLPFACKGGVCCTCKAKLISGNIEMDVNYALEPDEVAAGYILTCQAHPTTDEVHVSFDE